MENLYPIHRDNSVSRTQHACAGGKRDYAFEDAFRIHEGNSQGLLTIVIAVDLCIGEGFDGFVS